jgi:uncharacterized Zn finger protein (UPF0148 family)
VSSEALKASTCRKCGRNKSIVYHINGAVSCPECGYWTSSYGVWRDGLDSPAQVPAQGSEKATPGTDAEVKRWMRIESALQMMLKLHGCGCESITDGGWTCPAHKALERP